MKSSGRYLTNIFSFFGRLGRKWFSRISLAGILLPWSSKRKRISNLLQEGSFVQVLRKGVDLLDTETQQEIRQWIISQQTDEGGFPDRAGKCDLYYSLFGFFLADALDLEMVISRLKEFVKKIGLQENLTEIDHFCLTILYASLLPHNPKLRQLKRNILKMQGDGFLPQNDYNQFLTVLSLLYLNDYLGAWRLLKSFGETLLITTFRKTQATKMQSPALWQLLKCCLIISGLEKMMKNVSKSCRFTKVAEGFRHFRMPHYRICCPPR